MIKLPHNLEAEKVVLSTMLLFPDMQSEVLEMGIDPTDFYDIRHQAIFKAMCSLVAHKRPVDLANVADEIETKFENAVTYLSSISDTSPHSQCQAHVKIILELSALRKGIALCDRAKKRFMDSNEDVVTIIDEIQSDFINLSVRGSHQEFATAYESMNRTLLRYREMQRGNDIGVQTGFSMLDQATGGLRGSKFIVIAGRPGQGKTSLALTLTKNMCSMGFKVGFFSLEMDHQDIENRLISIATGINCLRLNQDRGPDGNLWPSILEASSKISNWDFFLNDDGGLSPPEIKRKARLMKKKGAEIIFIDQLSKIKAKGRDRFEQRANAVAELSPLAKELRMPIVLLAQINREVEKRGGPNPTRWTNKPQTWQLKDTGLLEENSDLILLVYRPFEYTHALDDEGFANLEIAKQRNGPRLDIELQWDGKRMQFTDGEGA